MAAITMNNSTNTDDATKHPDQVPQHHVPAGTSVQAAGRHRTGGRTAMWATILAVLALLAAACGGDSESSSSSPSADDGTSVTDSGDDGQGSDTGSTDDGATDGQGSVAEAGPVNGPVISILTFGMGLLSLDRDSGEATDIAVPQVAEGYSERDDRAMLAPEGDKIYVLIYSPIEGQEYSNDVLLSEIDRTTGVATTLTVIGQDRPADDSTDIRSYEIVAVSPTGVWVTEQPQGDEQSLLEISRSDGAELSRILDPDNRPQSPIVVGDSLYALRNGVVSQWDGGSWADIIDLGETSLGSLIDGTELDAYSVTRSGEPVNEQLTEFSLNNSEPLPNNYGWVAGDDEIWWLFNDVTGLDDDTVITAMVVRLDLATGTIGDLYALDHDDWAEFTGENESSSFSQATYAFHDDQLWMADIRDDGRLYRVDRTDGVTSFVIPGSAEADFIRIELLPNDPEGVWIEVSDWTIQTEEEGGGRSSSGVARFERIDPATGQSMLSIVEADLFDF